MSSLSVHANQCLKFSGSKCFKCSLPDVLPPRGDSPVVWTARSMVAFYTLAQRIPSFRHLGKTRKSRISLSPPHTGSPSFAACTRVRKRDAQTFRTSLSAVAQTRARWKPEGRGNVSAPPYSETAKSRRAHSGESGSELMSVPTSGL